MSWPRKTPTAVSVLVGVVEREKGEKKVVALLHPPPPLYIFTHFSALDSSVFVP